jgi:hypothetical protein
VSEKTNQKTAAERRLIEGTYLVEFPAGGNLQTVAHTQVFGLVQHTHATGAEVAGDLLGAEFWCLPRVISNGLLPERPGS